MPVPAEKNGENRICATSNVIMAFAELSISAALASVAAAVFAVCALAVIISLRVPEHLQEIWQVGVPQLLTTLRPGRFHIKRDILDALLRTARTSGATSSAGWESEGHGWHWVPAVCAELAAVCLLANHSRQEMWSLLLGMGSTC
jgi:hypothetical protein